MSAELLLSRLAPLNARVDQNTAPQAEQALLGALLLDSNAFQTVAEIISAADFHSDQHRSIWKAIKVLRDRGEIPDLVTVGEELRQADAGLVPYVAALAQNAGGTGNIAHYARLIHEKATYRRLGAWAGELSDIVGSPTRKALPEVLCNARVQFNAIVESAAPTRAIRAASAEELISLDLPELAPLMTPWLFQKNLVMVHSKRGIGKTHFAMGISYAISTGETFLGWSAPTKRGVLYVDGEMPVQLMQRRVRELTSGYGEIPELLRIVTPDLQDKPMPDLATPAGQAEIDALVTEETALIVVDNLSCLVRSGGAENESESWGAVAEWALRHRRQGRAVMFVHHSGKTGAQRGTSKREDLLDVVINLRRPGEYQDADGAVFEVHFEKARSLSGEDIAPLEAKLEQLARGGYAWSYTSAATRTQDRIKALWNGGTLTLMDVVREVGCSKSHAHKTLAAAMQAGELERNYPAKPRKETR
jgi:hypothetical protein